MNFSIGAIAQAIIQPLRYHFAKYGQSANLMWSENDTERTIDIFEAFDGNRLPMQNRPRIVISRGSFSAGKVGLTDNMAEAKPFSQTRGNKDITNFTIYQGAATVTVEARNKGTCELIADMAAHFLLWSRPIICDAMEWKDFASPLSISDCVAEMNEDPNLNIFQVQMQVPWTKEEVWKVNTDGAELKKILLNVIHKE